MEFVWIVLEMGTAVLWRVGLGAIIGLVVGIILMVIFARLMGRENIRTENESTQKLLVIGAIILWVLFWLPGIAFSGAGMGSAYGVRYIMDETAVVEKAGTLAFTGVYASVASATDEQDPEVQRPHADNTKAYFEGEITQRIDTWADRVMSLPEEASAWTDENLEGESDEEGVEAMALAVADTVVTWFLERELRERREYLTQLAPGNPDP